MTITGQNNEPTPRQRQAIKADVAEARKGPYHGPFKSAEEFAVYFKAYKRRRSSTKSIPIESTRSHVK